MIWLREYSYAVWMLMGMDAFVCVCVCAYACVWMLVCMNKCVRGPLLSMLADGYERKHKRE